MEESTGLSTSAAIAADVAVHPVPVCVETADLEARNPPQEDSPPAPGIWEGTMETQVDTLTSLKQTSIKEEEEKGGATGEGQVNGTMEVICKEEEADGDLGEPPADGDMGGVDGDMGGVDGDMGGVGGDMSGVDGDTDVPMVGDQGGVQEGGCDRMRGDAGINEGEGECVTGKGREVGHFDESSKDNCHPQEEGPPIMETTEGSGVKEMRGEEAVEAGEEGMAPGSEHPARMEEEDDPGRPTEDGSTQDLHNGGEGGSGESSRSASPEAGGVITVAMVDEERRLREGGSTSRENSVDRDQELQKLAEMQEHQRFARLQHLLQKSSIYSQFLLQRMEKQKEGEEEGEKEEEKEGGKDCPEPGSKKKAQSASGDKAVHKDKSSEDSGVAKDKACEEASSKKIPGRKRKAVEDSYKLSDYMDSQGHLKKRKLEEGEAVAGPVGATPTSSTAVKEEEEQPRFFDGKPIPARQPKLVSGGILKSYQLDGMEWIKVLYENGVNGILADEMGLGKTIQCISVIAHMIEMGVKGPFLIAAPLSTVPNWVAEFKRFTPTIPVVLYHGTKDEREHLRRQFFPARRRFSSSSRKKSKKSKKGPRTTKEPDVELQPVIVTSYEICMRDQQFLQDRGWKFLVVDEGHRIKNLNCKLIRALKAYDAGNRLLLTGTPLQNNLSELWSLLNFLLPDIFDDLNSFQSWFDFDAAHEDEVKERIIAQEREQHVLTMLHQILTPFLLRRLKTDVEFSLPPKKEVLVYAPLTPTQQKYYKSLLDNTILERKEEVSRGKKGQGEEGKENQQLELTAGENVETRRPTRKRSNRNGYAQVTDEDFELLLKGDLEMSDIVKPEQPVEEKKVTSVTNIKMTNVWMMLRKCCNHPYLLEFPLTEDGEFRVDEDLVNSCGKILLLDRMLPALIKDGHKMLLFSQFTMMLDILEDYLELRGVRYGRLDGSMAFSERQRQMTTFSEDPDCYVFLLSTRAGGLGINLTAADTVIIYDSDWNPQADLQAQDRCHRIGQSRTVMVYRLVTANTIDQRIVERAGSKRRLEKMVIHKGRFKGYSGEDQQLSVDDLMDLLHSVDHDKVVSSGDVVISDDDLRSLLDRNLSCDVGQPGEGRDRGVAEDGGRGVSGEEKQSAVFRVIEERESGKVININSSQEVTTPHL